MRTFQGIRSGAEKYRLPVERRLELARGHAYV
jgi:hypothetical protein